MLVFGFIKGKKSRKNSYVCSWEGFKWTIKGIKRLLVLRRAIGREGPSFAILCSLICPFSSHTMPPVWLRPESGGDRSWFQTVANAIAHLKANGTKFWATQVSRAAKKPTLKNGWSFRSTAPHADD